MATFRVSRRSFGTIVSIQGRLEAVDGVELEKVFEKFQGEKLYFDLEQLEKPSPEQLTLLVQWLEKCRALGCVVTVGRANPEIRRFIQASGLQDSVSTLDFLDEALFQAKRNINPRIRTLDRAVKKTPICPSCGGPLQTAEALCRRCGSHLQKRRADRSALAIPFFYGIVSNQEFMNSNWTGAVTEDLDTKTFSGLGYFNRQPANIGTVFYYVFPTLRWDSETQDQSSLVIFRGRIKNCHFLKEWYRIGVALIDLFEYRGRFLVSVDDEWV